MMTAAEPFEVRQVTGTEWVIIDHRLPENDARAIAARVTRVGADVCKVIWLVDYDLPTRYISPWDVVEDLRRATARSTRPIPIPHFAPPSERPSRHAS